MHKYILKSFDFLKSIIHFIKILTILSIILVLFYWVQALTNSKWGWMEFSFAYIQSLVDLGEHFSDASFDFFGAIFEFKYAIAIIFHLVFYYLLNCLMPVVDTLKMHYKNIHIDIKHVKENIHNEGLRKTQETEQKKINKYKIYVAAQLKKKFMHAELNYNLDEELVKMNKYLITETEVQPEEFEGGFLYSFDNFNKIDKVLKIFNNYMKSDTLLTLCVCVQIFDGNYAHNMEYLKKLISLKFENKISTMSDTAYRYRFNECHAFGVSQLGVFQHGAETVEVHEFVEI